MRVDDRADTDAALAVLREQARQQVQIEQAQRAADRSPARTGLCGVRRRLKAWLSGLKASMHPAAVRWAAQGPP